MILGKEIKLVVNEINYIDTTNYNTLFQLFVNKKTELYFIDLIICLYLQTIFSFLSSFDTKDVNRYLR